jgi:hypothetical protein
LSSIASPDLREPPRVFPRQEPAIARVDLTAQRAIVVTEKFSRPERQPCYYGQGFVRVVVDRLADAAANERDLLDVCPVQARRSAAEVDVNHSTVRAI